MAKNNQKETNSEAVNIETQRNKEIPAPEPTFSNGELGQLQEILYGSQQRATNEQIAILKEQIEEQIETLGNRLSSRINQLTESITQMGQLHEQKLADMQKEQQSVTDHISNELKSQSQQMESRIALLGKSSNEEVSRVQSELKNVETAFSEQLNETRHSLQAEMHSSVDELQNKKLDTQNLAQLLGKVSEQLNTDKAA